MRLFRFISKGNASAKALPMTTPVFYRGAEGAQSMAFVMPEGLSHESVPAPLDSAVRVMARKGGNFAVLRIRGGRGDASRARAQERLKAALNGAAWRPEGEPEFAFYDPPWIPSFLERNEVLWRVVRTSETHGPR